MQQKRQRQTSLKSSAFRKAHLLFLSGGMLAFLLSGCISTPISKSLHGQVDPGLTFARLLQDPSAHLGKIVLLGGEIIQTENTDRGTDVLVLEKSLGRSSRPEDGDASGGRFVLHDPSFLDPAIFSSGRKITAAGEVVGDRTIKIGELDYRCPLIRVREVHLWANEPQRTIILAPYPPWYPYRYPWIE